MNFSPLRYQLLGQIVCVHVYDYASSCGGTRVGEGERESLSVPRNWLSIQSRAEYQVIKAAKGLSDQRSHLFPSPAQVEM